MQFAIFNYDRCVEHYLHRWLDEYYGQDCKEVFEKITFLHTYGSLGDYLGKRRAFIREIDEGPFLNAHLELVPIAEGIKILTEQEDTRVLSNIRQIVNETQVLIFLGFAFETQNMKFFPRTKNYNKKVFGTTYGFTPPDKASISDSLKNRFGNGVIPPVLSGQSTDCKALFSEFSFSINQAIGSSWHSLGGYSVQPSTVRM